MVGILPAGTVVKHGTTSVALAKIIREGLRPVQGLSVGNSPPKTTGIYVGGSIAYHAAVVAFSNEASRTYQLLQQGRIERLPVPTPIVLRIRLKEDVPVHGDEDFLLFDKREPNGDLHMRFNDEMQEAIRSSGLKTWQEFGSTVVVREGGIPAEWVEGVEIPNLNPKGEITKDPDFALMIFAFYQHQNSRTQQSLLEDLESFGLDLSFSKYRPITKSTVSRARHWFPKRTFKTIQQRQQWLDEFSMLCMRLDLPVRT